MRHPIRPDQLVEVYRIGVGRLRLLHELHRRKSQHVAAPAGVATVAFVGCRHVVRGTEGVDRAVRRRDRVAAILSPEIALVNPTSTPTIAPIRPVLRAKTPGAPAGLAA